MSNADSRQHAARKRAASEARLFRPSKKGQASTFTPTEKPDVPSASVPEPILVLSASKCFPLCRLKEW